MDIQMIKLQAEIKSALEGRPRVSASGDGVGGPQGWLPAEQHLLKSLFICESRAHLL